MKNKTPILFIIFNRQDTTQKVFDAIRKYKPRELYIAADGPRENKLGEKEKCEEARKITEEIDWPCKVKRLYRDKNLGCKYAVSGAIDWFFKNVEEGIILEDDCLPNSSFFTFCEQMLSLYRNDKKVMCISGDNFLPKEKQKNNGYYFSKYVHIWGWASWRRAWKNYDVDMKTWSKIKTTNKLSNYFVNFLEKMYWNTIFNATSKGKINTWDYQFVCHVWKNSGFALVPSTNLVSNIGFTKDALHTNNVNSILSNITTNKIKVINKKKNIERSIINDDFEARSVYKIDFINVFKEWLYYTLIK